jgi:phytoene dehydrogenase-like protein
MKRSAAIIGSGPNGLAAAIVLAQSGFDVEVREAASVPGGAARSGELTLPGFVHDLGSAIRLTTFKDSQISHGASDNYLQAPRARCESVRQWS